MEKELVRFGENTETLASPFILVLVAIGIVLILVLPRRHVLPVMIFLGLGIPYSQRLVIFDLDFTMLRLVLLFAWLRVVSLFVHRKEDESGLRFIGIDRAVILWCVGGTITFTLLWMDTQALVSRIGYYFYTTFGSYLLLRLLIRGKADVTRAAGAVMCVTVMIAVVMAGEKATGYNYLMSAPAEIRDGVVRAQGPFAHPILAGTFGGTVLPICFWIWSQRSRGRWLAILGMFASTVTVVASASSTAIMTYVAGVAAMLAWPLRRRMRQVRWGVVLILVVLHNVMKAPVWSLIGRIDLTGASASYHRYMLVDQLIWRFPEWALLGVKSTNAWGVNLWDTANQFVEAGTTGGLVTLVAFLMIITRSFRAIGVCRKAREEGGGDQWGVWCLGAAMFAHVVGFLGVSYFDQTILSYLLVLAMIAGLFGEISRESIATSPAHGSAQSAEGPSSSGFMRPFARGVHGFRDLEPVAHQEARYAPLPDPGRGTGPA
jgi:hypothetical protein